VDDVLLLYSATHEICYTCGSGDRGDELLLCDRCDRSRHTFLLCPIAARTPLGPCFCPDCAPPANPVKSECLGLLATRPHISLFLQKIVGLFLQID
jgi:hypothetical protein